MSGGMGTCSTRLLPASVNPSPSAGICRDGYQLVWELGAVGRKMIQAPARRCEIVAIAGRLCAMQFDRALARRRTRSFPPPCRAASKAQPTSFRKHRNRPHRKSAQALLALRRSTVTPTEISQEPSFSIHCLHLAHGQTGYQILRLQPQHPFRVHRKAANTAAHLGHFRPHRPGSRNVSRNRLTNWARAV